MERRGEQQFFSKHAWKGEHTIYGHIGRLWQKEGKRGYLEACSVHVQVGDECCIRGKITFTLCTKSLLPLSLHHLTIESFNHTWLLFYLLLHQFTILWREGEERERGGEGREREGRGR